MATIRVILVDDHAVMRSGLKALIETQRDLVVVGEAGSVSEALLLIPLVTPDVVVTDLSMPGVSGAAFVKDFGLPTVVLSMHEQPLVVRRALAAGARAFVPKSSADTSLLTAIRTVAGGGSFVDPRLTSTEPPAPLTADQRVSLGVLSARERSVLGDVARGYTSKEIAASAHISEKTVETYRRRIREKLGISSRVDFLKVAMQAGLVDE
jgi:DNA-binding NarL/FixJ family response regulator